MTFYMLDPSFLRDQEKKKEAKKKEKKGERGKREGREKSGAGGEEMVGDNMPGSKPPIPLALLGLHHPSPHFNISQDFFPLTFFWIMKSWIVFSFLTSGP